MGTMHNKANFTLRFPTTEKPAKKPRTNKTATEVTILVIPAGIHSGAMNSAYVKKSTTQTAAAHALAKA